MNVATPAGNSALPNPPPAHWPRLLLLALLLAAFAHAVILLDAKDLWWDESLSLQRAEESLPDLLRGVLTMYDGFTAVDTIDQHPFFSFLLQGLLIRTAGDSVFVLRYVAALAAVLLAAGVYLWARWLERRDLAPRGAALWATALAAVNPFMLWYGQEARPYALWAALALVATYLLLRATETARLNWPCLLGFVVADLLFVLTHYYAVFLIALHLLILAYWSFRWRVKLGMIAAGIVGAAGALVGGYALWFAISQKAGQNFPTITVQMLIPDLVNAFSLGPSADLALAWPLDLLFAALALLGMGWGLRSREAARRGGWVLPAALLLPVLAVLLLGRIQPLYMNARHLGMLVGPFTLLVGAGLAVVGGWRRWAAWPLALILFAGIGWSTVNYHTLEQYDKDDYTRLGAYMDGRIMPGDVVLYYPPFSWRIFDYYLPIAPVRAASAQGADLGVYGLPLLRRPLDDTYAWLAELGEQYDRIWVVKSRTHPYLDLEDDAERWLRENFLRVRDVEFFSTSSLRAQLYLPEVPVYVGAPPPIANPVDVEFAGQVRLTGYEFDPPAAVDLPSQTRLYWEVNSKPARRLKYILSIVAEQPDGSQTVIATLEREPYEGDIPTIYWDPGRTLKEFVELPARQPAAPGGRLFITFQMYDAETLEKLPVTAADGAEVLADGVTAVLPFVETE